MEEEEGIKQWSCATNWITAQGSIHDSLSFESPATPIEINQDKNDNQVLVLNKPPSPDSTPPCEITVFFQQSHEIRQVYVRSTARIYEIYYGIGPQSTNEYLCTVRCGIAAKEDPAFDATDTEAAITAAVRDPSELHKENGKIDSNNGSDEDGWVEVKVSESPLLDGESCSLAKVSDRNMENFYEATAEITDASPCRSLTIRLLSLQTKDSALVEEIYIFGEPSESEDKVGPAESSAGNSLITMLVPTLLQLSKTGNNRMEDKSHVREKREHQDAESSEIGSFCVPHNKGINVEKVNGGGVKLTELQSGDQVPQPVMKGNDASYNRIERVMDQLVCRVGRIEAFCLRFEENMLKPLSNIETRLQRLEQQLEVLTEKSQSPKLYPDEKTTVPEFSCDDAETYSLHNADNEDDQHRRASETPKKDTTYMRPSKFHREESESICDDDHCCGELESSKKHSPSSKASSEIDDASDATVAPHFLPSLIMKAPEFLDDDEDGCGSVGIGGCDDSESTWTGPNVDKRSSSLDDALASALSGFLSSTSLLSPKVNETSFVKDSKSSDGDDATDYSLTSPSARIPCERAAQSGTTKVTNLGSISLEEVQLAGLYIDGPTRELAEGAAKEHLLHELGANDNPEHQGVKENNTRDRRAIVWTDDDEHSMGDTISGYGALNQKRSAQDGNLEITSNGYADHKYIRDPRYGSVAGTVDTLSSNVECFGEEDIEKSAFLVRDVVGNDFKNITGFKCEGNGANKMVAVLPDTSKSSVDFELPILDVEFFATGNLNTRYFLETLLDVVPEAEMKDMSVEDNNDCIASGEQSPAGSMVDFAANIAAVQDMESQQTN